MVGCGLINFPKKQENMGSLSPPKLPVIEFSSENLKPGTSCWISTCKDVLHALEEYGCFIALYDKLPLQLHNALFNTLPELFDLPLETKRKNVSDIPYYGYTGNQPHVPSLFEGMGINNAATLEGTQEFTNTLWPNGNDHLCETLLRFSKLAAELEQLVKRMVFEGYGVKYSSDSVQESTLYLLRMLKYRVPEKDENNLGIISHTDKNYISVLHQNEVNNGLEVKTKDGQWISFEPSSSLSSFTVLAGEAFLAWSNGRIHAPFHKVVMSEASKTRYSVGLFSFIKGMVKVPEELIDEQNPLRFKPFDNFGLLRYYGTTEGMKKESVVKAYCGV